MFDCSFSPVAVAVRRQARRPSRKEAATAAAAAAATPATAEAQGAQDGVRAAIADRTGTFRSSDSDCVNDGEKEEEEEEEDVADGVPLLATASEDSCVRLWDVAASARVGGGGRQCVGVLATTPEDEALRVSWSPDARLVAAGTAKGKLYLWQNPLLLRDRLNHAAESRAGSSEMPGHAVEAWEPLPLSGQIYVCDFAPTSWASGTAGGSVLVGHDDLLQEIDVATRKPVWSWRVASLPGQDEEAARVAFGGDRNPDDTDFVFDAAFAPGSDKLLAAAVSDGTVRLVDRASASDAMVLQGHDKFVTSCAFAPPQTVPAASGHAQPGGATVEGGGLLATTSGDATVCIWDLRHTATCLHRFGDNARTVFSCCFAPASANLSSGGGPTVLTCSADATLHAYSALSGECTHVSQFRNYPILNLAAAVLPTTTAATTAAARGSGHGQLVVALCGGNSVMGGTPVWVTVDPHLEDDDGPLDTEPDGSASAAESRAENTSAMSRRSSAFAAAMEAALASSNSAAAAPSAAI